MTGYKIIYEDLEKIKLKGLTATLIKKLNKRDIYCLYDLFYYFPKTYENSAVLKNIFNCNDGETVILKGEVLNINKKYIPQRKMMMVTAVFSDNYGTMELVWFNNVYVYSSIPIGTKLTITGKIKKKNKIQMINPSYKKGFVENLNDKQSLEPVYPLTYGLTQQKLRQIIKQAIDKYGNLLEENIPIDFIYGNKIMSRKKSILNIHFPENEKALELAIRRFTYEEIMILEMGILKKRYINDNKNTKMYFLSDNKDLVKKYISSLNFELTDSQKKVIAKIYKELNEGKIINRLIQGDVGSGKTIVALIMMLYISENKYQCAFMAPTEILALQHYLNIYEKFAALNINVALVTSSLKGKKKEQVLEAIKNGEIDIVIGTHSLISDDVVFKNLALSVIDEQQKFGVEQRNILRQKANIPNILVMSATPIPRSLALTIYGDLDVSIISELPKGRKKVITKWIKDDIDRSKMYEFIKHKLDKKQQVYIVSPLIEESEKLKMASAIKTHEEISKIFSEYKVGLVHGKQTNKEKDEVMQQFRKGKINILVSTTVIEVGVDVSNANIIIINNAERFGLSSLHQLRGRVGRGKDEGYCFLDSQTDNEISKKRLEILEKETDGFKIANEDLKLRNSGEIFGLKQSGISDLVLLDIVENIKEIEQVKDFVKIYLKEHGGIIKNEILQIDIDMKQNKKENN